MIPLQKRVTVRNLQSVQSGNGQGHSKQRSQQQSRSHRVQLWERAGFQWGYWGFIDLSHSVLHAAASPDVQPPPPYPANRDPRKHYTTEDCFAHCSSVDDIAHVLNSARGQLRAGDVTDAFQRTAKFAQGGHIALPVQQLLEDAALGQSQYLSPKDVSLILHAMVSLQWPSRRVLAHFSYLLQSPRVYRNVEHQRWLDSFTPRYFALIMNFMAQLEWNAENLVGGFHARIVVISREGGLAAFTAADLGCMVNALKKQPRGPGKDDVVMALAVDATRKQRLQGLLEVAPTTCAQYINDLVHLGVREPGLLSCFWNFLKKREVLDACNIRALSNIVSSLAETSTRDDEFVDGIVAQVKAQEGTFSMLSHMATCSMVLSVARLMQLRMVRGLPDVLLLLLHQPEQLPRIPQYFLCRMLDSLARAREAVPNDFPMDALRIVLSELVQPDRVGKFTPRDVTILIKVLPLLPEGGEQVQRIINSAQAPSTSASHMGSPASPGSFEEGGASGSAASPIAGPAYMVLGDAIKALRVAVTQQRAGGSDGARRTVEVVASQVKAHFRDKRFVYDNAAQFPGFIAQATGCFVQVGRGCDRDLLDAVTAPMLSQHVISKFSSRQLAQSMYNMFRLRYDSADVQAAVAQELGRDSRLQELQEQELAMALMAMSIQRYGGLRLFVRLMSRFTRDSVLKQAVEGVLGVNMALIALEEAKSAYRFSVRTLYPFAERCVEESLAVGEVPPNTLFYLLHVIASYRLRSNRYLNSVYTCMGNTANLAPAIDGVSIWWLSKTWWALRHVHDTPHPAVLNRIADLSLTFIDQREHQVQSTAYCEVLRTAAALRYEHPALLARAERMLATQGITGLKEYGSLLLLEAIIQGAYGHALLPATCDHVRRLLNATSSRFTPQQLFDLLLQFRAAHVALDEGLLQAVLARVSRTPHGDLTDTKPQSLVSALGNVSGMQHWGARVVEEAGCAASKIVGALSTPKKLSYLEQFASRAQLGGVQRACEEFGLQSSNVYEVVTELGGWAAETRDGSVRTCKGPAGPPQAGPYWVGAGAQGGYVGRNS